MTTTLRITKYDLDEQNRYRPAIDADLVVEGHIEIAAGLGWVRFTRAIRASLSIVAGAGSGIKAGEGIKAGWGIEAGLTITAKWLSVKLRIFAGICGWKIPAREEQVIDAEVRSGLVAHGVVVRSKETPA